MQIGVLIGSLRKESYNRKLFVALKGLAPEGVTLVEVPIGDVPLYNKDIEDPLPPAVAALKRAIEEKDALIFISPEYNRSIPGVMKNAIDWATRGGSSSFVGKPGAVLGITTGRLGTAPMQAHMKNVMLHVGLRVIAKPEVYVMHAADQFDASGALVNEDTQTALKTFIDTFAVEAGKS